MTIRGGGDPTNSMGLRAALQNGPAARSLAAAAHGCIMVLTRPGSTEYKLAARWSVPSGELLLPAPRPALVRCPGEAGVAGHRPPVPKVTRQDLVHEHVRGLDADADDTGQQADHRVGSFVRRMV